MILRNEPNFSARAILPNEPDFPPPGVPQTNSVPPYSDFSKRTQVAHPPPPTWRSGSGSLKGMSSTVVRFAPTRKFLWLACSALAGAGVSGAIAWHAHLAWIAVGLFLLTAIALFVLAGQPVIEIHETHLQVGRRSILWNSVRRVDQTNWKAPLAVYLTLTDESRVLLVYPGPVEACGSLLRSLRRHAREALLDGVAYRQFWGEPALPPVVEQRQLPLPRYPLLRPEDEEEVERMFQRLKTVGHIDQRQDSEK
jgi:Protein of unknown function (DUF3093)